MRKWLAPLALTLLLLLALPALQLHLAGEPVQGAWRDVVVYARDNQEPESLVVADGMTVAFNLTVYADILEQKDAFRLVSIPETSDPADVGPLLRDVPQAALDASMLRVIQPYGRLFVVSSRGTNPVDEFLGSRAEWERLGQSLVRGTYLTAWGRRTPGSTF